jgi:hypothetical protein
MSKKRDAFAELMEGLDALAGECAGKRTLKTHAAPFKPAPKITPCRVAEMAAMRLLPVWVCAYEHRAARVFGAGKQATFSALYPSCGQSAFNYGAYGPCTSFGRRVQGFDLIGG